MNTIGTNYREILVNKEIQVQVVKMELRVKQEVMAQPVCLVWIEIILHLKWS